MKQDIEHITIIIKLKKFIEIEIYQKAKNLIFHL